MLTGSWIDLVLNLTIFAYGGVLVYLLIKPRRSE